MKIVQEFLSKNDYSRPCRKIDGVRAIVIHWLEVPWQSAYNCRDYFESRKDGSQGYGSAHYIVGLDGVIVQCIPEDEVAYHCGSSQNDPKSGKIYTDLAREIFGVYAMSSKTSPNMVSIGIEHCHVDNLGSMTVATRKASIELAATLCKRYNLDPLKAIRTHNEIVGWKNCHKWFVDHPDDFMQYKLQVKEEMEKQK